MDSFWNSNIYADKSAIINRSKGSGSISCWNGSECSFGNLWRIRTRIKIPLNFFRDPDKSPGFRSCLIGSGSIFCLDNMLLVFIWIFVLIETCTLTNHKARQGVLLYGIINKSKGSGSISKYSFKNMGRIRNRGVQGPSSRAARAPPPPHVRTCDQVNPHLAP